MSSVLFTVEEPSIVKELGNDPDICNNAAFVFDKAIKLEPGEFLELLDGCVYLISHGIQVPISGKWEDRR